MISRGHQNFRKHKLIKNGDQYIALDISLKLDCLDNGEVTYSVSRYYVEISGKMLNTSLTLRTIRSSKNKQKARTIITDIFPQYFMKLLEEFKDLIYIGYRNKQVKKEPTESFSS